MQDEQQESKTEFIPYEKKNFISDWVILFGSDIRLDLNIDISMLIAGHW